MRAHRGRPHRPLPKPDHSPPHAAMQVAIAFKPRDGKTVSSRLQVSQKRKRSPTVGSIVLRLR